MKVLVVIVALLGINISSLSMANEIHHLPLSDEILSLTESPLGSKAKKLPNASIRNDVLSKTLQVIFKNPTNISIKSLTSADVYHLVTWGFLNVVGRVVNQDFTSPGFTRKDYLVKFETILDAEMVTVYCHSIMTNKQLELHNCHSNQIQIQYTSMSAPQSTPRNALYFDLYELINFINL